MKPDRVTDQTQWGQYVWYYINGELSEWDMELSADYSYLLYEDCDQRQGHWVTDPLEPVGFPDSLFKCLDGAGIAYWHECDARWDMQCIIVRTKDLPRIDAVARDIA